jgi:hypothetical protein
VNILGSLFLLLFDFACLWPPVCGKTKAEIAFLIGLVFPFPVWKAREIKFSGHYSSAALVIEIQIVIQ